MAKVVEVFTPNDLPTFTYVDRATHKFEERLRDALAIPKMIVSLSGPSKSGKTVLVNKVIERDNLIQLSGASIRSAPDLWSKVLSWMDVPTEHVETTGTKIKAEGGGKAAGGLGIPLLPKGRSRRRVRSAASQAARREKRSLRAVCDRWSRKLVGVRSPSL